MKQSIEITKAACLWAAPANLLLSLSFCSMPSFSSPWKAIWVVSGKSFLIKKSPPLKLIEISSFLAEQLLILMVVMILLSIVSLFLFIGACLYNRVYIMPWIWSKYCIVFIQIMRFITIIIQLSTSANNQAGPSPIFELVLLGKGLIWTIHLNILNVTLPSRNSGYNVFSLSIVLELVEEFEPYTFKRFQYLRV